MNDGLMYQYISCGLIGRRFHALEVELFQFNLLHFRPGCHYTPVGCQGMPKTSHGGFAYRKDGDLHRHLTGTSRHVMEKHCRTDYQYGNSCISSSFQQILTKLVSKAKISHVSCQKKKFCTLNKGFFQCRLNETQTVFWANRIIQVC